MKLTSNMIGWFEIPVSDLGRAKAFYSKVLGIEMQEQDFGPAKMAFFPWDESLPGSPGGLMYYPEEYKVSSNGVLVYFSSLSGDLNNELGRVGEAGGKVILEKKLIAEDIGYMALFMDTEGNKVALHSRK